MININDQWHIYNMYKIVLNLILKKKKKRTVKILNGGNYITFNLIINN